ARNRNQKGVDWQFTTNDARIKLKRLYPQFKSWHCTSFLFRKWSMYMTGNSTSLLLKKFHTYQEILLVNFPRTWRDSRVPHPLYLL
ncbi:hypothetical protein, partial [Desulfocucumis palustris]|uniref:hypothetical protein n=1 Tax=Desulfocucumis palustris TaxID=1898651 RepID=UPI001A9A4AC7